jgi:hypothetical protein
VRRLRHRTVLFLLTLAVLGGAWEVYLRLSAPGRLAPDLAAALARNERVNVSVRLGFAPEEFHIRLFQGYGVVRGVSGTTVRLDRVSAEDVGRLARYYWVRAIALER